MILSRPLMEGDVLVAHRSVRITPYRSKVLYNKQRMYLTKWKEYVVLQCTLGMVAIQDDKSKLHWFQNHSGLMGFGLLFYARDIGQMQYTADQMFDAFLEGHRCKMDAESKKKKDQKSIRTWFNEWIIKINQ